MSIHDSIGDMLTVVRNGIRADHAFIHVRKSRMAVSILEVLKKENYIYDFKVLDPEKNYGDIRIYAKKPTKKLNEKSSGIKKILRIQRVSRPGRRVYATSQNIPNVLNGLGVCVVSTSKGVMSHKQAKREKLGGEVLLKVW